MPKYGSGGGVGEVTKEQDRLRLFSWRRSLLRLNRSLELAGDFTSAQDELRRPRRIDCTARLSCSQLTSENSPHCSWPSLEQEHSAPPHPNLPEDSRSPKHFRGYRARLRSENTCRRSPAVNSLPPAQSRSLRQADRQS